jgi:DNA-binding GntR family transcriptional regulator
VVYDLLKERLLEGEFQAGERLSVESLKAEFGVSKQPVMDALRRLATAGLVEIIPQVGSRVPVYSGADVTDFFTIFGGMEGAVAGVAAQRCTGQQIETLVAINDEINDLAANPDPAARAHGYRLLNRRFHGVIHDMAHSPVVAELSHRMWDMSDLMISTTGVPQPLASAVADRHDDHEQIISALRDRDQAAARAAMDRHIVGTVAIINTEARSAR